VLAVDGVVSAGLRLAELTPQTQQALRAAVPEAASVVDPVDLLATVPPAQLQEALGVLLAAPEVDAVLAVCTPVDGPTEDAMARAVSAAATGSTPLLATFPGVADPPRELVGVPFFGHAEQAARALAKARRYAEWRAVPLAELTVPPPVVRTPALDALVADGGTGRWLPPSHVEELLRAVGIEVLPTVEVADASSAVAAAEEIGFPVVLKAHGPTLVHKADAGAVLLGLRSGREVAAAWFELSGRLGDAMSGGLVQRQLDTADGLELLAGASVDPEVGPLVLAGMGGTLTEVLDDRVLRVPPLTREEGLAQLAALRVGPALHGFRGRPAVDAPGAADVLVALGRLLASFPEVREVDLNPLLVTPTGACAVDARIAVGTPDPDPGAPFRALRQPLARRTP
jgi:acyl-CoA synthetase (NDP forming)